MQTIIFRLIHQGLERINVFVNQMFYQLYATDSTSRVLLVEANPATAVTDVVREWWLINGVIVATTCAMLRIHRLTQRVFSSRAPA